MAKQELTIRIDPQLISMLTDEARGHEGIIDFIIEGYILSRYGLNPIPPAACPAPPGYSRS